MQRTRPTAMRYAAIGTSLCLALLCMGMASAASGPLQIRRISPSGVDVQPGQEAVIQFDRAMVPLGHMGRKPSELPVSIAPDPGCQWRWLDISELACRLPEQHRFVPATKYTITVGTALKALDGSHLEKPVSETFTTWRPQVDYSQFQEWRGPVTPVFLLRMNLPVTSKQLAAHLVFVDEQGGQVAAKVEPFTEQREGPLWLSVPGLPGAVIQIDNPQPDTPLDANAVDGRRVWQVLPSKPLRAATEYHVHVTPGLRSPLGPLAGEQDVDKGGLRTYDDFAFVGVSCINAAADVPVTITPGQASPPRCQPNSVSLQFSAPVPRETLAVIDWQPLPLPKAKLAAIWRDYPEWYLRDRNDPYDSLDGDGYALSFVLDPMREWSLHVPAGVKDVFGRSLRNPTALSFPTGHREPFLDPPPSRAVLESGLPTIVPLRFTNLQTLAFDYSLMHADQLAGLGPTWSAPQASQSANLLQRSDLAASEDRIVSGNLGIREWLDGRAGVVWGQISWLGQNPPVWRSPYEMDFMGQVTPWQVLAKVGHYDTLVWVKRLDNGMPVAGAKLQWLHGHNHALGSLAQIGSTATTDGMGLAHFPGTMAMPASWFDPWSDHSNFYIAATRDDDMALLPLDGSFQRSIGDASHYALWGDLRRKYGHMRAWAVTEQGIYKPGSEVKYSAFVRKQGKTALEAPPAIDYTLTISDPEGNTVLKREHVKLSSYGGVSGQIHIGNNAPMGWYDISLAWSSDEASDSRQAGRFMVTDFVPATFKVNTQVLGKRFAPGETVTTRVNASLHAGGPYTNAKVRFTTRLLPQTFSPERLVATGFHFGSFDEDRAQAATLAVTEGRLDQSGYAQTQVELPKKSDVLYGVVRVEGAVESTRATWVASSASVAYAARDRFIGLRTRDWLQTATTPFKVEYLVTDPAGESKAGSKAELVLQRESIERVKVKNGAGNFTDEEHTKWIDVDHCQRVSKAVPDSCELTPPQAGRYRVVGTVTDTHGDSEQAMLGVWVTGAGRAVWSHDGEGVNLIPDKEDYHVGDVAHVLVQNPYPGAQALLTVERFGVLWHQVLTLEGSAPVIDVPITANYFPGAFLSVSIFSPRAAAPTEPDLGKPELAMGYLTLKVSGQGSSLDVAVTPAKAEYKPQQTVQVDVAVKAHQGKAPGKTQSGKTRLVVAVLDQGVLDLLQKGASYFDPRQVFYAPPNGPDVANYSLANQLLTALKPKVGKGQTPGGGGGESSGPNVRSNFAYATYWNAELETDANGRAHFEFTLPDNLTRWRIFVIAMRPDDAMGLGDASVRVNLPLQIEPALPNQMHVGDSFGAAFNVTNRTKAALSVATNIEATGVIKGATANASDSFELDSFAHQLAWLQLEANAPGDITLVASAKSGTLGDAVRTHIPVTPAGTEVVAAEYGSTTGESAQVPVKVPAKAVPGSAKVVVRFAPTLVGGLVGAFEVMRDEYLRTWEVRLSRSVLASDYLRLKPVLGDAVEWPDAAQVIDETLRSAGNFQAPNGGMSFWIARNDFVSPYLSVYTALAFDWLQAAGHEPPAQVRQQLWTYLHAEILAKSGDDAAAPVLRAGALAALALAPDSKLADGAVAAMLPQLHDLRLFGQALLLQAAIGSDDRASADAIAKSLLSHAEESAGEISFNEHREGVYLDILATPLRSNCVILDALTRYQSAYGAPPVPGLLQQFSQWLNLADDSAAGIDLLGTTPQKSMRWIAGQRRNAGGWPNSQENVFCTTAITHYADAFEPPVKALTAALLVPGEAAQKTMFASRAAPAVKLAGPLTKPGEQIEVKLARSGQGRLYYGVQLHYTMPADLLPAADAGMTLSRHYYVQRDSQWQAVEPGVVLHRGDIVRVELVVDAPTMRHHVVLTDPLPGAFEAVNRQLASAAQTLPAEMPNASVLMFDGGAWPNFEIVNGGFYHREMGFDAVRFFADELPAGHYRVVYAAQVIAPGTFIAPAPQIKEIYQPDVFGRGLPAHLQVAMPAD